MGIVLIGLIGSAMYVHDAPITIPPTQGTTFSSQGYTFTFEGSTTTKLANGDENTTVRLALSQGSTSLGTLSPGAVQYATQGQTRLNADVRHEFLQDVFVAFEGSDNTGALGFDVKINPLVSWTWAGFVVLILGTVLAVWPKREPQPAAAPARAGRKAA